LVQGARLTFDGWGGRLRSRGGGLDNKQRDSIQPAPRNNFPPHKIEHPRDDGLAGFDVDIIGEALERIGWSTEISFMPWKRALELAERGQYDGLCSCSHIKERDAKLLFRASWGRSRSDCSPALGMRSPALRPSRN
jgi:ABC-type amino acid transport substrate-binding protein